MSFDPIAIEETPLEPTPSQPVSFETPSPPFDCASDVNESNTYEAGLHVPASGGAGETSTPPSAPRPFVV